MKKVSSINTFFKRSTNGTNTNGGASGASSPISSSPGSQTPNIAGIEYETDDHVFSPAKVKLTSSLNSSHQSLPSLGSEAVHHPLESSGSSLTSSGVSSDSAVSPATLTLINIVEQYSPNSSINPNSLITNTSNNNSNSSNITTNGNINGPEIIKSALIVSTETVSPDKKPYTIYKMQVETNKTMYIIWRRYSEFLDIDLKLRAAYPLSRLPFPPKKTFGKMNNEFIEQRRDHLQQFVNALFTHPTLTNLPSDPIVLSFLQQNTIDQTTQLEITRSSPKQPKLANDQVVRYIISTLPFWSDLLDYSSLLALTGTCNYLLNTVSYYSDLWRKHYWDLHNILHFGYSKICVCTIELNNYLQERANGLKRDNTHSHISTSPSSVHGSPSSNPFINIVTSKKRHSKQISQDSTTSSGSPTPGLLVDGITSGGGSSRDLRLSSSSSSSHLTLVESMEYSRQVFLQLLATHYQLRTSPESHSSHNDCDCLAPKFRGTIIGIPNITGSFLHSFNTEFQQTRSPALNRTISSIDLESIQQALATEEEEDQLTMVSHIVSNGRMLCVTTSDSSHLTKDESRYNLSMCHFVLLAFSLVDTASFESIDLWVEDIKMMCPEAPIILVGLQRDLREVSDQNQSISYQQGLEKSQHIPNCLAYIESPSASDGIGGWRRSLLSELASQLITHYREVFIQHTTKRSNYTVRGSFLSKIFPRYPDDIILKGLTSYDGDVEKSLELLALDYANYIESNDNQPTTHKRKHVRGQSVDASKSNTNSWSLSESTENAKFSTIPLRQSVKISESQINSLVEKLKKNSVDSFIKGFLRKKNQTQDQQAEMVLSFLREMRTQLQSSQLISSMNVHNTDQEEDLTSLPLGEIENYLYQNIYKVVFSTQESLEKDVLLSDRMSRLVFVEPQHLEINQIHWNKDLWNAAEKELHSVNDLFSPSQKLECILNCCKIILFLLSNSDSPGGADDFLPHLIYVVIHANVPNLYSNFEFTSKFVNTELLKMERYYYFTTFGIAVTFIEGIDGKHLKIDPNEYEAYMTGKKKYIPEEQQNKQKELENEASRAKIMQKLGIDETTSTVAITSPTKKKLQLQPSDEPTEESFEKAISEEKNCKLDSHPSFTPSVSDGPLLPIQWATSSGPTEGNKRNSVKGMSMSRTPSPPDSKSLQVDEHPLALNRSKEIQKPTINTISQISDPTSLFSSSPMENSQPKPNEIQQLPPIDQQPTTKVNEEKEEAEDIQSKTNIDNPLDLNHNIIIE